MSPPELRTERLRLRQFCERDLDEYARMCADPEVMRFVGAPLSADDAWRQIATFLGHWQLRGYGIWAAEEQATGLLLGRIGLWNPHGWPELEVGWFLAREHWGRGLAAEGARAAMEHARTELGRTRLISVIHPDNERSVALARRLGGRRERRASVRDTAVEIYGYTLVAGAQTST